MAVTRKGQVIVMTAAADAVTDTNLMIQGISLDHSAAANCVIQDGASVEVARLNVTTTMLTMPLMFPKGIILDGIKASTLSAGVLTIYLMP